MSQTILSHPWSSAFVLSYSPAPTQAVAGVSTVKLLVLPSISPSGCAQWPVMRLGHGVLKLLDIQVLLGVTEEQRMESEVGCI